MPEVCINNFSTLDPIILNGKKRLLGEPGDFIVKHDEGLLNTMAAAGAYHAREIADTGIMTLWSRVFTASRTGALISRINIVPIIRIDPFGEVTEDIAERGHAFIPTVICSLG